MLTIFTIPKSFQGNINVIQRNAIKSWLKLYPKCEVILFGDDEGVAEVAKEFNILHIPEIEKTEKGTPLLNSAIDSAQKIAKNEILLFINADIILTSDLIPAVQQVKNPLFLISGQRWDIDINKEIDFNDSDWEKNIREQVNRVGKLHGLKGMDYCIFPRNFPSIINMPSLAVGRAGWDNWLIYRARFLKIPVIDASQVITAIHQNHDHSHSPWGKKNKAIGPEHDRNIKLAGGFANMMTLMDADWVLTQKGLKKPAFPRRIFPALSLFYPWRLILSLKRQLLP